MGGLGRVGVLYLSPPLSLTHIKHTLKLSQAGADAGAGGQGSGGYGGYRGAQGGGGGGGGYGQQPPVPGGAPPAAAGGALPPGWQECKTPEGTPYWYHKASGTSQWHRPT